ncbi:Uncharacterised protein [Mycobacteroides abscessus subsp. abscessus]|nr:Uncharacterised protein [Mycobacteroides abscessus subsp. abscessus]
MTGPLRLAGLHGHRNELNPHIGQRILDHLIGARAHPSGGDHQIGLRAEFFEYGQELLDIVGDGRCHHRVRTGLLDGGGEHDRVRFVDLPWPKGCAGRHQLAAG